MKKNILFLVIGLILGLSVAAGATILYNAKDIEFTPSDASWNVNNMQDAINDIKDNYTSNSEVKEMIYSIGSWEFPYKGEYYEFIVPIDGTYKIELWGAQGGSLNSNYIGGKGGYTSGEIDLIKNEVLYIYVGGQGGGNSTVTNVGGWNGGGYSGNNPGGNSTGGGGATDVRLIRASATTTVWNNFDSLKSRIMVAAGGGGTVYAGGYSNSPGYAGGLQGGAGTGTHNSVTTTGATQIGSGTAYGNNYKGTFGYARQSNSDGWGGGGGGGYYGGNNGYGKGGNGGSSFISGYSGCNAITEDSTSSNIVHTGQVNHYSNKIFANAIMIAGNATMPSQSSNGTMVGNTGHGYAKISVISID